MSSKPVIIAIAVLSPICIVCLAVILVRAGRAFHDSMGASTYRGYTDGQSEVDELPDAAPYEVGISGKDVTGAPTKTRGLLLAAHAEDFDLARSLGYDALLLVNVSGTQSRATVALRLVDMAGEADRFTDEIEGAAPDIIAAFPGAL